MQTTTNNVKTATIGHAIERLGRAMRDYPSIAGMTLRDALHAHHDAMADKAKWALGDAARFLGWDWTIPKG